jgi:hypothetical protein
MLAVRGKSSRIVAATDFYWTAMLSYLQGACSHALTEARRAHIDAAGVAEDRKGLLFRQESP